MRKEMVLPALALFGGAAGFFLRIWQRTEALNVDTKLYEVLHPATISIYLLLLVTAVLAFVLSRGGRTLVPQQAFVCPSPLYMTGMTSAALLFGLSAALGIPALWNEIEIWQLRTESFPYPFPISLLLLVLSSGGAAVSCLLVGRSNYRKLEDTKVRIFVTIPAYANLIWLIYLYQKYSSNPILLEVFALVLAPVFLQLALYHQAAFFYGHPHKARTLFCSMIGILLGGIALADPQAPFLRLFLIASMLCVLSGLIALSYQCFAPPAPKRLLVETSNEEHIQPEQNIAEPTEE